MATIGGYSGSCGPGPAAFGACRAASLQPLAGAVASQGAGPVFMLPAVGPTSFGAAAASGSRAPAVSAALPRHLKLKEQRPAASLAAAVASGVLLGAARAGAAGGAARCHRRRLQTAQRADGGSAAEDAGPDLKSELGLDYSTLRDLLKVLDFKQADAETRRLLIQMAGEAAVKRGWIYFAEVRRIPETDMTTVNDLWGHYSQGKFGFVPQRKIWRRVREDFDQFAEAVDWFTSRWKNRNWPDEFIYTLEAPVGHLPLTNCIRGAQVLAELLNHTAFDKKQAAPTGGSTRSALSMLALGRGPLASLRRQASVSLVGRTAAPWLRLPLAHAARRAVDIATPEAPTTADASQSLSSLELHAIINENGLILPDIPADSQASAFLIYDDRNRPQYLGFSKDLRNTLRTLLCRRPELCYSYKCAHFKESGQALLLQLRTAWTTELGQLPPGNKEPRQKALWESPVDGGALSERAYKTVAEQKAKQVLRQLKDRGLKEVMEFKAELIAQGKVDVLPSALSIDDLVAQQRAVSSRTSAVEKEVKGKKVVFEIYYVSEFKTNGGWWVDVEVSAQKQKSTHRVVIGQDFIAAVGAKGPREVVENAFAVLLAKNAPRKTEGLINSEIFPVNYFTATNLATNFPEFLELFGVNAATFDWDMAQWNFKQVHDYAQDAKRTIPAGPMGGVFDPSALQ